MATVRVGRYRLDEVIGVGSFATVHRATDERLDDTVVVKLLAENHSLNPEVRERFIAEGRSLRRVRSPHVVVVHDIGETDHDQPYLVLEHAEHGTLADRVAAVRDEGRPILLDDLLAVARQLAAAMKVVHAAHLVHRDLSPTNVLIATAGGATTADAAPATVTPTITRPGLLRPDERLVVADLGMCKDLARNSGLTVAGGTTGFRPPELDGGPAVIDARVDLWSLSALVSWVAEGSELPRAVRDALDRSLTDDPGDRHQGVEAWLAELEESAAVDTADDPTPAVSATAPGTRGGGSGAGSGALRWSGARLVPVVVAVTALALGGLLGWLVAGLGGPSGATDLARLDVEGPAQVVVGEPATFTLQHVGVQDWVWELPTGAYVTDEERVTLTPSGIGPATLSVTGRDDQGDQLEDVHRFAVVADE